MVEGSYELVERISPERGTFYLLVATIGAKEDRALGVEGLLRGTTEIPITKATYDRLRDEIKSASWTRTYLKGSLEASVGRI